MRSLVLATSLALATIAVGPAFAQANGTSIGAPDASPAARDAAQVVDAFMSAMVGGDLETARAQMTPNAVVVANGQVLGERDAYIDGAAKGDSAALRTVHRELVRRDARAGNDVAWVVSEKRLRAIATPGSGPSEMVVETMLLAKTDAGWKITHVHWSGRHG
jgi:ketosteroid isomerase-like protein